MSARLVRHADPTLREGYREVSIIGLPPVIREPAPDHWHAVCCVCHRSGLETWDDGEGNGRCAECGGAGW